MIDINKLVRKNIKNLKPYSSARSEFSGEAMVFLDANENPNDTLFNRYPDSMQYELKKRLAETKEVEVNQIFVGNGSDEAVDLLFRVFCEPNVDNVVQIEPTYGMYEVVANINAVELRKVELNEQFDFCADDLLAASDENTKLIFLCSPNNPTGNLLNRNEIIKLLNGFNGLVVLDEAYIDFCPQASFLSELKDYPNLVILQTLSKAWGMAALRIGMALAKPDIIALLNKVKYPYNISSISQQKASWLLQREEQKEQWVTTILQERSRLIDLLKSLPFVQKIYPSEANFLLLKVHDANGIYRYLIDEGVVVRNRSNVQLCSNCLRLTIGLHEENTMLYEKLKQLI